MAYSVDEILGEIKSEKKPASVDNNDLFDLDRIDKLVASIMNEDGDEPHTSSANDDGSDNSRASVRDRDVLSAFENFDREFAPQVQSKPQKPAAQENAAAPKVPAAVPQSGDSPQSKYKKVVSDYSEYEDSEVRHRGLSAKKPKKIAVTVSDKPEQVPSAPARAVGERKNAPQDTFDFSDIDTDIFEKIKPAASARSEQSESDAKKGGKSKGKKKRQPDIIAESFKDEHIDISDGERRFNFNSLDVLFSTGDSEPQENPGEVKRQHYAEPTSDTARSAPPLAKGFDILDRFEDEDFEESVRKKISSNVYEKPFEKEFEEKDFDFEDAEQPEKKKRPAKVKKIRRIGKLKAVRAASETFERKLSGRPAEEQTSGESAAEVAKRESVRALPVEEIHTIPAPDSQPEDFTPIHETTAVPKLGADKASEPQPRGKKPARQPDRDDSAEATTRQSGREAVDRAVKKAQDEFEEFEKEQEKLLAELKKRYGLETNHGTIAVKEKDNEISLFDEDKSNFREDAIDRFFTATRKIGNTLVKHARKADLEKERENRANEIDGQIKIEGFEPQEAPRQITEEELKTELLKNRENKIKEFSFKTNIITSENDEVSAYDSSDEADDSSQTEEQFEEIVDYKSEADERAIYVELKNARRKSHGKTVLMWILEFALILVNILGSGIGSFDGAMTNFGLNSSAPIVYIGLNLVILLIMILLNLQTFAGGLWGLVRLKFNSDSILSAACILTVVQSVLCASGIEAGAAQIHIYPCVAGFALLLNCMGKAQMHKRIFGNFRALVSNKDKHALDIVNDEAQAGEMGRGTIFENPYIRYCVPIDFATGFLKNSYFADPADIFAGKAGPWIALAGVLVGAAAGIATKSVIGGFGIASAALLVASSTADIFTFNMPLARLNKSLNRSKSFICGFGSAQDIASTDCVVLDSSELFPAGTCNFHGIKLFNSMRIDEAITYVTAVLKTTDSPLKDVFVRVVDNNSNLLPPVDGTAYEERMGISAWIYNRRVLVGSQELLEAHGVSIPDKANPYDYIMGNQRVMFLALDGKACAMFIVSYSADKTIRESLKKLEASGVSILVKTPDANLDEKFLAKTFGLGPNTMRVMSSIAGGIYEKLQNSRPPKLPAHVVTGGRPRSFISAVAGCVNIVSLVHILTVIQVIGLGLGMFIVALCGILGAGANLGPIPVILYEVFWLAVQLAVVKIKKL